MVSLLIAASSIVFFQGDALEWRRDLDSARAAARASGRPLLVVFRCER